MTCTISVTFKPTYAGTRLANLVIPSNDPATPLATIPLVGTGGKVPLTITAGSLDLRLDAGWLADDYSGVCRWIANGDLAASFNITCTSTYKAGGLPGTYPTSCLAGTNVNNAYTISYVSGALTVMPASATMISPVREAFYPPPTQTFTWTSFRRCDPILPSRSGPRKGKSQTYISYPPYDGTSVTVPNLPMNGSTIYVRLGHAAHKRLRGRFSITPTPDC